jgi:heme-degrading monooxygenase HmoA
MYARTITLQFQPGKTEDAIRLFNDSIALMFKQQKGFKEGYLVGDRNTGKAVSFSLWQSETDATALDTSVSIRNGSRY